MAISPTTGASASLSTAGTSLAFTANTLTNGRRVIVNVSILATTVSVSSISDGANTYTLISAQNNGTNVRIEQWSAPITAATASRTITINFSGSTLASGSYQEYSGSTGLGNVATGSSGTSSPSASQSVTAQDSGSYLVAAFGIASSSGDVLYSSVGTIRQNTIPALTTAGVALLDALSVPTMTASLAMDVNNSRSWASVGVELRTGVAASSPADSNGGPVNAPKGTMFMPYKLDFLITGSTPVPVAQVLHDCTLGTAYSETIGAQGGASPYTFTVATGALPSGTSLNSSTGVISGTPTTAGTYNFTILVTDANGATGTQPFTINVVAKSGANICVVY